MLKIINEHNGHFNLQPQLELKPFDSFDSISALPFGKDHQVIDLKNGYKWLGLVNIELNGLYFNFNLCFFNEKLQGLDFVVNDEKINASWDSWSEKKEQQKVVELEKWLYEQLGQQRLFDWGEIAVSYDRKGGFASIFVRYYSLDK